jgi:hypothetical protein
LRKIVRKAILRRQLVSQSTVPSEKSIFDSPIQLYSSGAVIKRRCRAKMYEPKILKLKVKFKSDFFKVKLDCDFAVL